MKKYIKTWLLERRNRAGESVNFYVPKEDDKIIQADKDDTIIISKLDLRNNKVDVVEQDLKIQASPEWFCSEETYKLFSGCSDMYCTKMIQIYSDKLVLLVESRRNTDSQKVAYCFELVVVPNSQEEKRFALSLHLIRYPDENDQQVVLELYCGPNLQSRQIEFEVLGLRCDLCWYVDYESKVAEINRRVNAAKESPISQKVWDFIDDFLAKYGDKQSETNKLVTAKRPTKSTQRTTKTNSIQKVPNLSEDEYTQAVQILKEKELIKAGRANQSMQNLLGYAKYLVTLGSITQRPQQLLELTTKLHREFELVSPDTLKEFLGANQEWLQNAKTLLK